MTIARYEDTATRLESRGSRPPTKEYVDELVESILASGLEACWHSAVDPDSRALFPSKVYPNCHQEASMEAFRYLIERVHSTGRPIISWYSLNHSAGLVEDHPDWRLIAMQWEGHDPEPDEQELKRYSCFNSPYGNMIVDFAVEIVRDVGFDGIWFDGSTFAVQGNRYPGCVCRFCRERFRTDTGFDLPEKVDFSNRAFRVWINWRYDVLMDTWQKVVDAVNAACPHAVVCFNNYRRRSAVRFDWNTGIPLRPLALDAVMSSETGTFPGQADIQIKINRAYGFKRGVETWVPLSKLKHPWGLDVSTLPILQACLGCLSAGGVGASGSGAPLRSLVPLLRAMHETVKPRLAYVDGQTVEYAAILVSQQTMDFGCREDPRGYWNHVHGMNELLRHAHLQSSVMFDAHVRTEDMKKFPVVVIGSAVCLSDDQARALKEYVRDGGVLVACARVGELDEMGYPHQRPVLDGLLGITDRHVLGGKESRLFSQKGEAPHDTGNLCMELLVEQDCVAGPDVEVLLETNRYDFADLYNPVVESTGSGLWRRKVGMGRVVYAAGELFEEYLQAPSVKLMTMMKQALIDLVAPAVTVDAPICLTMNARELEDGRWVVHLHNAPGSAFAYPNPAGAEILFDPGEVVPVHDVRVRVGARRIKSAISGVTNVSFPVADGKFVTIPDIHLHDAVVMELE